jgi:hypothetical protein
MSFIRPGRDGGESQQEVFPLTANGHFLQTRNATPFPLLVRTLWSINGLNSTDYQALIDNTSGHGFTAFEMALNHSPVAGMLHSRTG